MERARSTEEKKKRLWKDQVLKLRINSCRNSFCQDSPGKKQKLTVMTPNKMQDKKYLLENVCGKT